MVKHGAAENKRVYSKSSSPPSLAFISNQGETLSRCMKEKIEEEKSKGVKEGKIITDFGYQQCK